MPMKISSWRVLLGAVNASLTVLERTDDAGRYRTEPHRPRPNYAEFLRDLKSEEIEKLSIFYNAFPSRPIVGRRVTAQVRLEQNPPLNARAHPRPTVAPG